MSVKKTVYRSKIDWWFWLITVGFLGIIWFSAIGMSWWYVVFVSGLMTLLYAWLMFGCWYEIDGNERLKPKTRCMDLGKSVKFAS